MFPPPAAAVGAPVAFLVLLAVGVSFAAVLVSAVVSVASGAFVADILAALVAVASDIVLVLPGDVHIPAALPVPMALHRLYIITRLNIAIPQFWLVSLKDVKRLPVVNLSKICRGRTRL